MSILNPDNVFDQFSEVIPGASAYGEDYLGAVARHVREERLPVSADVKEERLGVFRGESEIYLVLTPVERHLRRYPSYHFGRALGATLSTGWYLLGKVAAGGLGGWAIAGGASQRDMDDLEALVAAIHQCAVLPGMQEIFEVAGIGSVNSTSGG